MREAFCLVRLSPHAHPEPQRHHSRSVQPNSSADGEEVVLTGVTGQDLWFSEIHRDACCSERLRGHGEEGFGRPITTTCAGTRPASLLLP